ncbi:MAG TPA: thioredoxin family protein [Smithellaceae bacterium]|nr:thioredoxin family protein [Smithellaceae bacterium]
MGTGKSCAVVDNLRDLEEALQQKDRVIALVYASWCPFCRRVLPVFEKQALDSDRNLLLVADDEEHIADLYGIDVFPTLILFEKNQIVKRLDAKPGLGLNEKQITDFISSCPLF